MRSLSLLTNAIESKWEAKGSLENNEASGFFAAVKTRRPIQPLRPDNNGGPVLRFRNFAWPSQIEMRLSNQIIKGGNRGREKANSQEIDPVEAERTITEARNQSWK